MKSYKYILLFIALIVLIVLLNSKQNKVYRPIGNGLRPGMRNSGVPLGRPMWDD